MPCAHKQIITRALVIRKVSTTVTLAMNCVMFFTVDLLSMV